MGGSTEGLEPTSFHQYYGTTYRIDWLNPGEPVGYYLNLRTGWIEREVRHPRIFEIMHARAGEIFSRDEAEYIEDTERARMRCLRGDGPIFAVYDTIRALFVQSDTEDRRLTDQEWALIRAMRLRTFRLWEQEGARRAAGELPAFTFWSILHREEYTRDDPSAENFFAPDSVIQREAHPRPLGPWMGLPHEGYELSSAGDAAAAAQAPEPSVDRWAAAHGVAFAAEAVIEYAALGRRDAGEYAARARQLLAEAPRSTMAETVARLSRQRERSLDSRVLTSFLFPLEFRWVAADTAEVLAAAALESVERMVQSITDLRHLEQLMALPGARIRSARTPFTVAQGVGPEAARLLAAWAGSGSPHPGPVRSAAAQALAAIPTDEAFLAALGVPLAESLLAQMTHRYPRRAVRVLGMQAAQGAWLDRFHRHVLAYPEAVEDVVPKLPIRVAALVERVRNGVRPGNPLREDAVPAALRTPRWARPPRKRAVIAGLPRPTDIRIVWHTAEREQVRTPAVPSTVVVDGDGLDPLSFQELWALVTAETPAVRSVLQNRAIQFLWDPAPLLALIAVHGVDVHDAVIDVVRRNPALVAAIVPFRSPEAADLATGWISEPPLRETAATWLRQHPVFAARMMIPAAVDRDSSAQQAAGNALRFLADLGYRDDIDAAATDFGVADTVTAIFDELERPAPELLRPAWWLTIEQLPPVTMRDSLDILPDNLFRNLITMLRLSAPGAPYPELAEATAACDPDALSDAVWSIYRQWNARDDSRWPLTALATLGQDRALRALRAAAPHHFTDAAEILGCSPEELTDLLATEQHRWEAGL